MTSDEFQAALRNVADKARQMDEMAKKCHHLFQQYRQVLSDLLVYRCMACGTVYTESDRRIEKELAMMYPGDATVSEYFPVAPLPGTPEWYALWSNE